ncbi:MAG: 2-C-methyl-D-erythritol 4-phosphate cytidylyltransferase, partial [Dialister sp.]|nr:2-C-methyl-D-erythritol 4-phosphate cytidylyltransferase [Dialister sp.]
MNSLILVAAGQGSRMGAPVNKLLLKHRGHSLISYTLRHVFQSRFLEELKIVARVEEHPIFSVIFKWKEQHITFRLAPGGATR